MTAVTSGRLSATFADAAPADSLVRWEEDVRELLAVYREIDRRGASLPTFSLRPMGVFLREGLKLYILFLLDIMLLSVLVPLNIVVFLRNHLSRTGRWRYRMFTAKRLVRIWRWVWSGEAPFPASVVVGGLVRSLLRDHMRDGLQLVRRQVVLDDTLSDESQGVLLRKIDRAREIWAPNSFLSLITGKAVPAATSLWGLRSLLPGTHPLEILLPVASVCFFYVLPVVLSAFVVKRGIMLGGVGQASYFPGSIKGAGAYARERAILVRMGLRRTEMALDIWYVISSSLTIALLYAAVLFWVPASVAQLDNTGGESPVARMLATGGASLLVIGLAGVALIRRRRLGRQ
jgi:hypothetical protein